jgi:lysophospholipase L1-like esterase
MVAAKFTAFVSRITRRSVIKKLALLIVSLAITLLALEGLVRVFFPQSVVVPWQDEVNGITAPRPNVSGRHAIPHTFDVMISFSAQRFRGSSTYPQTPAQGTVRIATLGDSFTFGYGANDNESYPANLERRLQNDHAEVINAANAGTGTGEQALWYDAWVKNFHPRIVILTVTSNDVDDDAARHLFALDQSGAAVPQPQQASAVNKPRRFINAIPGYNYVAEHSQLWGLIRNALSAALAPKGVNMSNRDAFTKEGLPLMSAEVRWLNQHARADNARLVVVFVPSRESIYVSTAPWADDIRWKSQAMTETLSSSCARDQIPFLDLSSQLKERSAETLYYDGLDTHPTPKGYDAIAEIVASFLVERKIIQTNH